MKTSKLLLTSSLFILVLFLFSCSKTAQQETVVNSPQSEEFVHFTIDGVDTSYEAPADQMIYHPGNGTENTTFAMRVGVTAIHHYAADSNYIAFNFTSNGISAGSSQALQMIILTGMQQVLGSVSPQYVHITEYGNAGEYVAGYFDGMLVDRSDISHTVHIDFRIKRT